jgi:Flp pilus assembly pilin Flp
VYFLRVPCAEGRLREDTKVDRIRKLFARGKARPCGQAMAEYVMIVSAVAVVVFGGYQATGTTINALVSTINSNL